MIDVGSADDFVDGAVKVVTVGAHEVGIVRWNDRFFAIRNVCPHQFGPICAGMLRPFLVASQRGSTVLSCDDERPVVTCPWHGWEFFADSGRAVWNQDYRVRTYGVHVDDGRVYVDAKAHALELESA